MMMMMISKNIVKTDGDMYLNSPNTRIPPFLQTATMMQQKHMSAPPACQASCTTCMIILLLAGQRRMLALLIE
jgi:hypothetical protein